MEHPKRGKFTFFRLGNFQEGEFISHKSLLYYRIYIFYSIVQYLLNRDCRVYFVRCFGRSGSVQLSLHLVHLLHTSCIDILLNLHVNAENSLVRSRVLLYALVRTVYFLWAGRATEHAGRALTKTMFRDAIVEEQEIFELQRIGRVIEGLFGG